MNLKLMGLEYLVMIVIKEQIFLRYLTILMNNHVLMLNNNKTC